MHDMGVTLVCPNQDDLPAPYRLWAVGVPSGAGPFPALLDPPSLSVCLHLFCSRRALLGCPYANANCTTIVKFVHMKNEP